MAEPDKTANDGTGSTISRVAWGRTAEGQAVDLYTLRNAKGMEVRIATYGGTVVGLSVPDRDGHFDNVVLGFESLAGYRDPTYLRESPYFGALIGRYANRIADGRFSLAGQTYQLASNNGPNHLHGGLRGFDKVVWTARKIAGPRLKLTYSSPAGEEGYPGRLTVTVVYTLTGENSLKIEYDATTDQDTVVNLTSHSYFNLKGAGHGDIVEHELHLAADHFTPVNANLIPTGEIRTVAGTNFDFTRPTAIGARINLPDEQLSFGNGYDHNFVLSGADGSLKIAARLREPMTGRVLEIWTTEPGLQLYSGNSLTGNLIAEDGRPYLFRGGLALETQHFPDSPNQPGFPTTVLMANSSYQSTTVFHFSVECG